MPWWGGGAISGPPSLFLPHAVCGSSRGIFKETGDSVKIMDVDELRFYICCKASFQNIVLHRKKLGNEIEVMNLKDASRPFNCRKPSSISQSLLLPPYFLASVTAISLLICWIFLFPFTTNLFFTQLSEVSFLKGNQILPFRCFKPSSGFQSVLECNLNFLLWATRFHNDLTLAKLLLHLQFSPFYSPCPVSGLMSFE